MGNIYIDHTASTGKGLFANTRFKREQILFKIEGKIIVDSYDPDYRVGSRWIGIDDETWISPPRSNYAYYLNHSCSPNAGLKDKILVVAMRGIKKGEEITIDYSTTEADPYWEMRCECGRRNCRKIIRSIQFLPEKLYRTYEPFVPEFLRRVRLQMGDAVHQHSA